MKTLLRPVAVLLAACMLLSACATGGRRESPGLFDLGPIQLAPMPAAPAVVRLPPLTVADIQASSWLETPQMFYRLAYANAQQPQPYASSRWATPPVQLFAQRVKARLAEAGGVVLSAQDGAANIPVLRIEVDDFTQHFTAPGQSSGHVSVRASVFRGRTWLAQKSLSRQVPAPTPDAAGGVRALAAASDAVITDMMAWLAGLQLKP